MLKTTSIEPDTVWLLRVDHQKSYRTWILYNEVSVLRGKTGESRAALIHRWIETHGSLKKLIRYSVVCRESEAAAAMATDMVYLGENP